MTQENIGDKGVQPEGGEPKPLSPEEELVALRQQLGEVTGKLTKAEEEAKAHQREVGKKAQELQQMRGSQVTRADLDELRQNLDLMAGMIVQGRTENIENLEPQQKQDLLADVKRLRSQQDAKHRYEEAASKIKGYEDRVTALGLTEDNEDYLEIYDLVTRGVSINDPRLIKRAELKLSKLEVAKSKEVKSVETEEKKPLTEEDEEAIARKYMEKKGYLKQETGSPSAKSTTREGVIKRYAEGDPTVSSKEYEEAMKNK